VLAPLLGAAGLTTAVVLLAFNYALLTGTDAAVVNDMPWLYVLAGPAGVAYATWMRRVHPRRYAELARVEVRRETGDAAPEPVAAEAVR
jgi:hypothetical protein